MALNRTRSFTLASVAAGVLILTALYSTKVVHADGPRLFELRIYHAVPGKLPALESRFRDTTSKLLARHHLDVVGYWKSADEKDNTFVFMIAHQSRAEADKDWKAFRADPDFQAEIKSEQSVKLVEKIDVMYLDPAAYSSMK